MEMKNGGKNKDDYIFIIFNNTLKKHRIKPLRMTECEDELKRFLLIERE